jgi:hypothetical protein
MTLLPDKLTPLSHDDLIAALRQAYQPVFGRDCLAMELAIYYGQCILENGAKLDALHCFGLGNVKAMPSWDGDTVTYQCDETVTSEEAAHAAKLGPCELHPLPSGKVRVVCFPGHPWAIFRAFRTARDAAEQYLKLFTLPRYAQAALRARAGDAAGFVRMAHAGGYFTAPDVGAYERAVASIAAKVLPACMAALEGRAGDIDELFKAHVAEQVLLTLSDASRAALDRRDTDISELGRPEEDAPETPRIT